VFDLLGMAGGVGYCGDLWNGGVLFYGSFYTYFFCFCSLHYRLNWKLEFQDLAHVISHGVLIIGVYMD
jgi:hypothetical protein